MKQLSGSIYRSRNEGDSIKILLPTQNILDIEENPVLEAANTIRLRAIDNDETYAMDEVLSLPTHHAGDFAKFASIFSRSSVTAGMPSRTYGP